MRTPTRKTPASWSIVWSLSLAASMGTAAASCATAVRFTEEGSGGSSEGGGSGAGGSGSSSASSSGSMGGAGPCALEADCAAFTDACNKGACINGACKGLPTNDGAACDDGKNCTSGDHCEAGMCTGALKPCPSSDACHVGMCDVATDACVEVPGNDGSPCIDQDPCTNTGTCKAGVCGGGQQVDCSFLNTACGKGVCDSMLGCVVTPLNDGAACEDGLFCTTGDTCQGGACQGGGQLACAPPGDACHVGACDENANACSIANGPNGVACDDKNACTMNETCSAGACTGGAPVNEGGACDDQIKCTANDTCQTGKCKGTPIVACVNDDNCCPAGCTLAMDNDCIALGQASYDAVQTFQDAIPGTTMMLAWDGTYFWSCSGGGPGGDRLAKYDAAGVLLAKLQPNIDFRAVFTKVDGTSPLFARGYSDTFTRVQIADGVFQNDINLAGGVLDAQSGVVWDDAKSEFVAMLSSNVTRWSPAGQLVGTVTLQGFGSMNAEDNYPQNRGLIARGGWYLTYANQVLSAWDASGVRQKTTILNGAGVSFDSLFALSYAAGKVWIVDGPMGTWRGYDVGL